MKKYMKTTLGRKLAAFYFVVFAVSFYFMVTFGQDYIYEKALSESQQNLRNAATTLLSSHISQQAYTKTTIRTLYTQLEMASETSNCRILILCDDGDIVVDTGNDQPTYNVYRGDTSFLRQECTRDFTMNNYLSEPSLCITLQMEQNPYLNGYLVFAQKNSFIKSRADYYFNILSTLFYLMAGFLALAFIGIYFSNFRPLRKLRNGAKDFSITHENPPILIHTNDEYGELAQTLNVIGEELNKFEEYQRKFISNISHDFRSPLTSIRGYVQAMIDGIIPPENQEKYLNIILFETDRLAKLTTDLLDVNNYDKDNIFLDITEFDIHEVIRSTVNILEGIAEEKGISFVLSLIQESPLFVQGDSDKIRQVLHNLMDNAIKFSDNGSHIYVSTRTHGDKVFISVKDTGIGIPREEQGRIWDRFYKTDLSRGKDKLGTGLGLSISREIINAHRQTIDVVSTVGVGSDFVFTLPKA
ncbi:MAG: HAMP domain-containing histidine kinase [Lachnospiraceae bacterium]|nr:HAMP domain-containing histidine kinase [Lachnospiraceae bacterium]